MPTGRAALLLRRLSTGDSKLKNLNLSPNQKDTLSVPVNSQRDLSLPKRLSTLGQNHLPTAPQIKRNLSDNIIKMNPPSSENSQSAEPIHTNSLINEKSPYLLQHAHNPVKWYPWGQEAFDKAKKENKMIFLSIGYSTCHWCHVMERESFENEDIAEVMNKHFVNIKVDREERPDIDRVYMMFIVANTGHGGWPMSVFLTPDLRPITGGTYFPPEDHWGKPGFKSILLSIAQKWKLNQNAFKEAGVSIMEALQKLSVSEAEVSAVIPGEPCWNRCYLRYMNNYEPEFGGWGLAPKFPQASIFNFLFHFYARDKTNPDGKKCLEMCLHTLTKIAKGGIHDHVSSGFARYSVDNDWHVPHFEKMLYDQAQLMVAYTDAYLATKDEFFADVTKDIIKYVNRDLRHGAGGYYSAEDADSYPTFEATRKEEGAFCVWEYDTLKTLFDGKTIGDNHLPYLDIFCDYFSIHEEGNISPDSDPHEQLKGKNVLIIYGSNEETAQKCKLTMEEFDKVISECLAILYDARQKRPRPHLDSKILCSWNGLMIAGLAQAGQGLGEKQYVEDAIKTATFIKTYLYDKATKTLLHSCYRGEDGSITQSDQPIKGFLDDYAFLIKGLLDLYEASLDLRWLQWARALQRTQDELFWDAAGGGYFSCSQEDDSVVLRLKGDQDGAEPSGNSVSCHNLLRLAAYADKSAAAEGGDKERDMARMILGAFAKRLLDAPTALPEMMSALMFYTDSPTQAEHAGLAFSARVMFKEITRRCGLAQLKRVYTLVVVAQSVDLVLSKKVVIAGGCSDPRTLELVRVVRSRLLPGRVLAVADPADGAPAGTSDILLNRIRPVGDRPTAYVCRRYACSLPVTDVKQLETLLDEPPAPAASSKGKK